MAASYLKETVESIARAKKIDLTSSLSRAIWEANKKLDRGEIGIEEAINILKNSFGFSLDKFDYAKIKEDLIYRLGKNRLKG